MKAKSAVNALAVLAVVAAACVAAVVALPEVAGDSYTVTTSVLRRPAAASVDGDAEWTPTAALEAGAEAGAAADADAEFELDASGKPQRVVKSNGKAAKPAPAAAAAPQPPLSRAEKVQKQLNGFAERFEVVDQRTDHTGARPRFEQQLDASPADAQAEAERAAQAHADVALAVEQHAEAAAAGSAAEEAEEEHFSSLLEEAEAAEDEADAEMELGLLEAAADKSKGKRKPTETSPAARHNENYACFRWTRPPRAATSPAAFAPREGHASWLSGNGKSLYVFGGCDRQTLPKNCYGELKQMNLTTRAWRNRKILGVLDDKDVALRMQGAAHAADTKTGKRLFVFGGLRVDATENSAFSNSLDLLFYDKRQKEWSWTHVKTTGDHPPPSQDATLLLVGDQLILFGGYSDAGFFNDLYTIRTSPTNVLVDEKDPELWRWKKVSLPDGAKPPGRRGHSMSLQTTRGGSYRAYVFGGVNGASALNDMHVLRVPNWFAQPPAPKKGSAAARARAQAKEKEVKHWGWKKVVMSSAGGRAIPSARAFHAAVVVRPRHLLVFGGCDPFHNHCYDDVLLFNTRQKMWLPTPPSLLQSALAPVVKPRTRKGKAKDGKAAAVPLPQSPKRRFPPWNPSERKKQTVTLLPHRSRVLVLGGCDRTQCFDDVYEMDLKGVCIDSCGAHGRFVDYRAPIVKRKAARGAAGAKKSFIELAAQHTAEQAQAAFAAQFEADEDGSEAGDEDEDEAEAEDADESEVIDEEELAESQMLEAVELSAEQAEAARDGVADSANDDTIDHSDAEINAAALAFVELDTELAKADGAGAGAGTASAAGAAGVAVGPAGAAKGVDPDNKPPRKMKLIRKKGLRSKKAQRAAKRKAKAKAKKQKFVLNGADLSKLSLEALKELNKERSLDAKCMCRDGYTGKFCQNKSKCHLNCSGSKRGLCVTEQGTDYCKCAPGFWGQGCEFKLCTNNCTSHGVCTPHVTGNVTQTMCKCEAGFWGKDCSLAEEWRKTELEKQTCAAGCTGMGKCSQNYTVNARTKAVEWYQRNEFNLHPLNRPFDVMSVDAAKIKDPKRRAAIVKRQADHRKQHAERIKTQPYKCKCRPGFGGDACQHQCPLLCSRHGSCNATGQCVCDSGWSGAGCNVATCGADDKCTYHGTCDAQKHRCKCDGAFRGPACDIDTACSGHGKWVKGTMNRRGHCKCNAGWFLEDCSLQLSCPVDCAKHGRCVLSTKKQRKAARAFKPLSRTSTPKVKGAPDFALPPLPRVVQGTCVCSKGFQSADCSQKVCPKGCSRHGECHDGKCACYPGYSGADCGNVIHCAGNCTDALHGTCTQVRDRKSKLVKPKCKCRLGWAGADCSQIACPNNCKGAGKCLAGKCQCKPGRFGADCSIKCPRDCSGHGECQSTGKCACDVEYTGADCAQRKSCPSKTNDECSGHGLCHIPSGKCHCEPGFTGKDCSKDHSSCANKECSGHGKCSFGKCFCQIGFSGDDCELKTVCKQNCNNRGICNMGKCECNPGWAGDACDVQVWDNTCPGNCNNHGLCSKGVCSCVAGWTGSDCNTVTDFCKDNDCSGRGTCVYNKCQCLPGTHGAKCEHGSTCPNGCDAKQGVCLLGVCHCLPGFTGPTCSQPQVCPGVTALGTCNGHGVCVQGTCACEPGWGGADCGSNMAPQALQAGACPNECSGAGVCYMGKCFCVKGFGGHDCSIPYETRCPNDCAGHAPRYDQRGVCHLGKCLCHPGYTGESCEVEVTCPAKCSVNGVCAHGKCFCVAGWTGPACDWPLRGGLKQRTYEHEMKEISAKHGCGGCSMRGLCIDNKCVCEAGYGGAQCEEVAGGPVIARCPNGCNGQGTCVFGKCFCHPGWTGAGCDKALVLPCPNDCQQKGICRFGRCFCNPGFAGDDCSAAAKCDAQCGSHGVCLDGRCVCADGFSGEQCNIAVARTKPAASAGSGSAAAFIEADANAGGASLLEAVAHAHPNAAGAAGAKPSGDDAPAGPAREVHVTSYPFSLVGVVLMSVAAGVVLSSVAKCVLDKREQMQRHEALINPLLVPRNA